jgi:hypothetical protein
MTYRCALERLGKIEILIQYDSMEGDGVGGYTVELTARNVPVEMPPWQD